MTHNIVAVSGQLGTGKSEFIRVARELSQLSPILELKFAEPVYRGLLAMNPIVLFEDGSVERLEYLVARVGWEKAKEVPEVRRLLQSYGAEAGRDVHGDDCWVTLAAKRIKTFYSLGDTGTVIIDDTRFQNEVDYVSSRRGVLVKLLGVNRRWHTLEAKRHSSESPLSNILFDYLVYNTGTLEQFREHIKLILTSPKPTKQVILGNPNEVH